MKNDTIKIQAKQLAEQAKLQAENKLSAPDFNDFNAARYLKLSAIPAEKRTAEQQDDLEFLQSCMERSPNKRKLIAAINRLSALKFDKQK